MDHGGAAILKRAVFVSLVFAAGMAVGYAFKASRTGAPTDKEIRPGRVGFTNPLFDCEVGTYPRGRELSPFKQELERLVAGLVQLHDCGIVYSAQRPYFLCVMTRGSDVQRLAGVIAQASRFVSVKIGLPLPKLSPTLFE